MKKALIAGGILALFLILGFMFLLGQASPENAPQDTIIIELPDTFEK
jgi:hypothetical protein